MTGADVKAQERVAAMVEAVVQEAVIAHLRSLGYVVLTAEEAEKVARGIYPYADVFVGGMPVQGTPIYQDEKIKAVIRLQREALALLTPERGNA